MTRLDDLLDDRALRDLVARFSDAVVHADADAFGALWTDDGRWTIDPPIDADLSGRAAIVDGFSGLMEGWEFLVQAPQYGIITLDGDAATGRWLTHEVGRQPGGRSQRNTALYHDRYARTPDGWRFAERAYRFLLLDDSPVPGDYTSP